MKRNGFLILLLLTLSGCTTSVAHQGRVKEMATSTSPDQQLPTQEKPTQYNLANTLGVVVLSNHYGKNDFIRIYNQDGSLWYRFTFFNDDSDGESELVNEDLRPFAFHVDYFLLTLTCVGNDKDRYEVIVNEETRLKKYIRVDDPTMRFETWEEHVLGDVFNISFDQNENPLRKSPDGEFIDPNLFSPQSPVSAVEINGEWLRVKWSNTLQTRDNEPQYDSAWIRWKKDGKLLIELGYIC